MNTFDPETHSYLIDGKPATGITTVISVLAKPALVPWAARMVVDYIKENSEVLKAGIKIYQVTDKILDEARVAHTKKKDAGGTHGKDAHVLIEDYIKSCIEKNDGKPWPNCPDEHCPDPILKFCKWADEEVDHFLFSERRMFNKDLFIAGTADFACVMKDGKKLIGDFKTSSGVYGIDYFLQCAGYKILAEGEGDDPYEGCVIVRLGKDGSFDVHYRYDNKTDVEAFMACLTIYRAQATYKKPK